MSTWVLVSHLPPYFSKMELKHLFNKGKLMNEIRFVYICTDDYGIQNQAFIDFWQSKDAKKASATVDGSVVTSSDSRAISVAVIWSKEDTLSTVVVDRIPKAITTQGLFDMFEPFGKVIDASFIAIEAVRASGGSGSSSSSSAGSSSADISSSLPRDHFRSSRISQRRAHVTFSRVEYAIDAANKMNGEILSYECGPNGLGVKLLNADARNLKWKRDTFDYVKRDIPQCLLQESAAVTCRPGRSGSSSKRHGKRPMSAEIAQSRGVRHGGSSGGSGGGSGHSRRLHRPPRLEGKGPRDRSTGHRQRGGGGRRGTQAQSHQRQSPSHSARVHRRSVELEISQTTDAYDPYSRDRSGSGSASHADPRFCRDIVSGATLTREREMMDARSARVMAHHHTSLMDPRQAALVAQQQQKQRDHEVRMTAMQIEGLQLAAAVSMQQKRAEMEQLELAAYQAQLRYSLFTAAASRSAAAVAGVAGMTGVDTSAGGVSAAVLPTKSGRDKSRGVSAMVPGAGATVAAPPAGSASSSSVASDPTSDVDRSGYVTRHMSQMPVATDGLTGPHFVPFGGSSGDPSEVTSVPRLSGLMATAAASGTVGSGSGTRGSADSSTSSLLSDRPVGSATSALSPSTGPPSLGSQSLLLPNDTRMLLSPYSAAVTEAIVQVNDSSLMMSAAMMSGVAGAGVYGGVPYLAPFGGSAGVTGMAHEPSGVMSTAVTAAGSKRSKSTPSTVSPTPSSVTGNGTGGRGESSVGSSSSVTVSSGKSACTVSTACDGMSSVSRPRQLKPSRTQKKIDEEKRRKKAKKHSKKSSTAVSSSKKEVDKSHFSSEKKDSEVSGSVVYSGATYTPSTAAADGSLVSAVSITHDLTPEEVAEQTRVYERRESKLIVEMLSRVYGPAIAVKIAAMIMCIPLDERRVIISNESTFFAKAGQFHRLLMKKDRSK